MLRTNATYWATTLVCFCLVFDALFKLLDNQSYKWLLVA